ncbi:MAG: NAD(P)/FAD-dependent oxidoreductase [Puniceicoccales bacterium]|jgi:phytoene dehydrogenase-like protein|nr:NAD(P)/FAD-dependent oxidoreductase [Puniceicoccales bacterium]
MHESQTVEKNEKNEKNEKDKKKYDIAIIGSGLAGLTAANYLAKLGYKVSIFEQHYEIGGLAAWFSRKGGHIFDVSLHGFPQGMVKSCRKYWTKEIADSIVQLKRIRFVNPQFDIETTFTREDFTKILVKKFGLATEQVEAFFTSLRKMNFYDDDLRSTKQLFEEFFPGRSDVHRLLLEPIAYANGSTLDDEAITYGIVFSNFMSNGVFTFEGGTDSLINKMSNELKSHGVDIFTRSKVEKILVDSDGVSQKKVIGIVVNGQNIYCRTVISNANILFTISTLVGEDKFPKEFLKKNRSVRINNSSCQAYLGIRKGETIPDIGDLIFSSENKELDSKELCHFHTKSRTFSMYYPKTRPQHEPSYAIVASMNANWDDWASLSKEEYKKEKSRIIEDSIVSLEKFIPDVRSKIDYTEAATPLTFNRYTSHPKGTSFGTKFEGLEVSMDLPNQITGLYHTGSVGIIMSGWLGAMNYGVIVAHKVASIL